MKSLIRLAGACAMLAVAGHVFAADAAKPDKKADAAARDHSISVINEAVKTLSGEYEAHQKDPNAALREKADYFTEHPAPDLTSAIVLDAIARNYNTVPESCYVRWELLSFFDPAADHDKLMAIAPSIGSLYSRAPFPAPHPSLIPGIRSALDREAAKTRGDDVNQLNDLWDKKLAQWVADNSMILHYDDALYALLPDSFPKFKLGWSDLFDHRVPAGVSILEPYQKMSASIAEWGQKATAPDRRLMGQIIARSADRFNMDYPPKIFGQAAPDDKTKRVQFTPETAGVPNKPILEELAKAVTNGTEPTPPK